MSDINTDTLKVDKLPPPDKNGHVWARTRDNCVVRILCTDRDDKHPIVALIGSHLIERLGDGRMYHDQFNGDDIINNPIYHTGFVSLFKTDVSEFKVGSTIYETEEESVKSDSNLPSYYCPVELSLWVEYV